LGWVGLVWVMKMAMGRVGLIPCCLMRRVAVSKSAGEGKTWGSMSSGLVLRAAISSGP